MYMYMYISVTISNKIFFSPVPSDFFDVARAINNHIHANCSICNQALLVGHYLDNTLGSKVNNWHVQLVLSSQTCSYMEAYAANP